MARGGRISDFPSPVWESREDWSWAFSFLMWSVSIVPQRMRLWLKSFSWGQGLIKKTEWMSFKMGPFSLPKARGGFSLILSVNTWVKSHKRQKMWGLIHSYPKPHPRSPWSSHRSGFYILNLQQFIGYSSGFSVWCCSLRGCCSGILAGKWWFSACLPASPVLGRSVSHDLTSPTNLRRAVEFSVCSAFYLLRHSDNF